MIIAISLIVALFLIFFIIVLIVLLNLPPVSPTGPTGTNLRRFPISFTGSTGNTGSFLLQKVIKEDLNIVSCVNPLKVLDIVSIDDSVIVLTKDQMLISSDGISHKTPMNFTRIIGFNDHLLALSSDGRLWVLHSEPDNLSGEFVPVDSVNSKGKIVWVSTTNDQKYLWITYMSMPGQQFSGYLYNTHFKVKDKSVESEYRIYGTTSDKYVIFNPKNRTVTTRNGIIYNNVTAALLNDYNDLHTIPTSDTPPLIGLRLVCGSIYTLVTSSVMNQIQVQMQNPVMFNQNMQPVMFNHQNRMYNQNMQPVMYNQNMQPVMYNHQNQMYNQNIQNPIMHNQNYHMQNQNQNIQNKPACMKNC